MLVFHCPSQPKPINSHSYICMPNHKYSDYTELMAFTLFHDDIQKHKLPQTYDFHKYMVRSMEDEFNGILGIRFAILLPLFLAWEVIHINSYSYDFLVKKTYLKYKNFWDVELMWHLLQHMIFTAFHHILLSIQFPNINLFLKICSWPLWGYAIVCIFINVHGNLCIWKDNFQGPRFLPSSYFLKFRSCSITAGLNTYFWLSFIPAIVSEIHLFCLFTLVRNEIILLILTTPSCSTVSLV